MNIIIFVIMFAFDVIVVIDAGCCCCCHYSKIYSKRSKVIGTWFDFQLANKKNSLLLSSISFDTLITILRSALCNEDDWVK